MTQGNSVKGYTVTEAARQSIEQSYRSGKSIVFKNGYVVVRNKGKFTLAHWTEIVGGFATWVACGSVGGAIGYFIQYMF